MERITNGMTDRTVLANLENTYNQLSQTQTELSSGTAADRSPQTTRSGSARRWTTRASSRTNTQYQSNVTSGTSWMAATDTALSSMNNDLQTAQNLVIQGANGSLVADRSQRDRNPAQPARRLDQDRRATRSTAAATSSPERRPSTQPFTDRRSRHLQRQLVGDLAHDRPGREHAGQRHWRHGRSRRSWPRSGRR